MHEENISPERIFKFIEEHVRDQAVGVSRQTLRGMQSHNYKREFVVSARILIE